MNETLKIVIALLLIGLATLIVLRISGNGGGSGGPFERRILFVCDDGDYEICSVDTDGRNFRQHTHNNSRDFRLTTNNNGEVAFICARERVSSDAQYDLCYLNLLTGALQRLSNLRYSLIYSEYPLITNDGRIIYICFNANVNRELCSIRTDGSDNSLLTDNSLTEFSIAGETRSDIAFICVSDDSPSFFETEICTMNPNGGSVRQITHSETLVRGVQINNSGLILTNCYEDLLKNLGLCTTRASQSNYAISSYSAASDAYSMNNAGQVALQCADSLDAEICAMNANGTGFRLLTSNSIDDRKPTINDDGIIAYHCGTQICLINFNGSGLRELTSPNQLPSVVEERLEFN